MIRLFGPRGEKVPPPDPALPRYRVETAVREDKGRFAALRKRRVVVYWPHGLGDWAHLGHVAPLLEPSNAYAVLRFGDDYVSMMDGDAILTPFHSGALTPSNGATLGAAHLGLVRDRLDGGPAQIVAPAALYAQIAAFGPDALLWTDYPETEGRTAYPFHTKARNLARLIVAPERLEGIDLSKPLPSSIDFNVQQHVQAAVDERLAKLVDPSQRLAVIARAGVTAARKNWGDGSEARAFVAALRSADSRWRAVSMDEEDLGEGTAGFRALFGDIEEPFASTFKALAARTALFAGVPAGPLHVTMARGGVPVVGLWLAHHPDWYDEPNADAIHLVGRHVRDRGFDRRPATATKPPSLQHRLVYLDSLGIPAADAYDAAREVL